MTVVEKRPLRVNLPAKIGPAGAEFDSRSWGAEEWLRRFPQCTPIFRKFRRRVDKWTELLGACLPANGLNSTERGVPVVNFAQNSWIGERILLAFSRWRGCNARIQTLPL